MSERVDHDSSAELLSRAIDWLNQGLAPGPLLEDLRPVLIAWLERELSVLLVEKAKLVVEYGVDPGSAEIYAADIGCALALSAAQIITKGS